ncbi:MAG: DUF3344 domain-containing protein, partial [Methanosarcinaceae archaeon]|nr:DUF3344 domain-containing protein [Methanosarcinaceae archaeon]
VYFTQPEAAYKGVGWTDRTETWTAADLPVPGTATIEKVLLYFSYNWDQTAGGYPWLNLSFNGNTIENGTLSTGNGTLYRDWSNFGAYADYEYGLCVYDVSDKFNSSGNSLVINPYDGNNALYSKVALYPSTLVVIYSDPNATQKLIFINEECDELGVSATSYGTTMEEATAYAPFTGLTINLPRVQNATLHSFVGSAGPDEGNLLFNGNTVATNAWMGTLKTAYAHAFDVKNYLNSSDNEAAVQGTASGGMVALQQILVVEYADEEYSIYDFSNNTPGTAGTDHYAYEGNLSNLQNGHPIGISTIPGNSIGSYSAIAANDSSAELTNETAGYAAQRFIFNISESESNIDNLTVTWIGTGTNGNSSLNGARLFIWNSDMWEYESLVGTTSGSEVVLMSEVNSYISEYIADGNVMVLVVQMGAASGYSRLDTDYVKLVVDPKV